MMEGGMQLYAEICGCEALLHMESEFSKENAKLKPSTTVLTPPLNTLIEQSSDKWYIG